MNLNRSKKAMTEDFDQTQRFETPLDDVDKAWREEIRSRLQDLRDGHSVGRPAEEVFEELEREFL
jgi:hypothetical protein